MKKSQKKKILFTIMGLILSIGLSQAQTITNNIADSQKLLEENNMAGAVEKLIQAVTEQQKVINQLSTEYKTQKNLINQQREVIQQQATELQKQREEFEKEKEKIVAQPPAEYVDSYGAILQYEKAYSIQHIAIFEVRRKDAPPYFRKAIEEYSKVVKKFGNSEKADDAQYRIAKILHRYLKEYGKAIKEYQYLLKNYPDSEYVSEAEEALRDLGAPYSAE